MFKQYIIVCLNEKQLEILEYKSYTNRNIGLMYKQLGWSSIWFGGIPDLPDSITAPEWSALAIIIK